MSTVAQMVFKYPRAKCVQRKCDGLHGLMQDVWSQNRYVFMKNDHNSLRTSAAEYHSFSNGPDIDFNYFLLFQPFFCR